MRNCQISQQRRENRKKNQSKKGREQTCAGDRSLLLPPVTKTIFSDSDPEPTVKRKGGEREMISARAYRNKTNHGETEISGSAYQIRERKDIK